jgi:uncharacterized protein YjbI with pentapeptide repeats
MDAIVEAALIGAAATLIGVGGTVIVAVTSARNARLTNQATINAAQADASRALEAAREAQAAARDAQFADRYSRALEQLGSDAQGIRIGGILALEGLALDSPRNHPTVMEVLVAYIREHAKGRAEDDRHPRADVQAALTVIGRRKSEQDIRPVNLAGTDLSGADLSHAKLRQAILRNVNLHHADLTGADLNGAQLQNADLRHAYLLVADLRGARLKGADIDDMTMVTGAALHLAEWPRNVKTPERWKAAPSLLDASLVILRDVNEQPGSQPT